MELKIGATYFMFCQFPDMKRAAMLTPHGETTNRKIHAALFPVLDNDRKERYERLLATYRHDYPDGNLEYRLA